MKIEIEELSPVERQASIEIPAEKVDTLLAETYRQVGQQVRLKGFRKGRIPRKVLEQLPRYRDMVTEEVVKRLEEEGFREMLDNHVDHVLSLPEADHGKLVAGAPYQYTATLEVAPQLELEGLDTIEVVIETVEVEDADVDKVLDAKREAKSTLAPLERGAAMGDVLKLEVTELVENEDDQRTRPFESTLGEGPFPDVVEEGLVGIKTGETREIDVPSPGGDDDDAEKESKPFRFFVEGVYERVTPALDDEFAKDEEFDDLDAMRAATRKELEEREAKSSKERSHEKLMAALVERYEVPYPPRLLERHLDSKVQNLLMQLRFYTNDQLNMQNQQLRESMRNDAVRDIQHEFLLQHLIKEHGFEATPELIDAELEAIAARQGRQVAFIKSQYKPEDIEGIGRQVQRDMARDHLLSEVSTKEETLTKTARDERIKAEGETEHAHDHDHDHDDCGDPDCNEEH